MISPGARASSAFDSGAIVSDKVTAVVGWVILWREFAAAECFVQRLKKTWGPVAFTTADDWGSLRERRWLWEAKSGQEFGNMASGRSRPV